MTKILVVDDEIHICLLIKHVLEGRSYACDMAASAVEARALLEQNSYVLVLSDVRMPGESGLDLAHYIKTSDLDTALVMVSVIDDPDVAAQALDYGAYGYLTKPFESNELLIQVENALRRRRLEIENRMHHEKLENMVAERTAELAASEKKYRLLVETMNEGLAVVDEEARFTFVNQKLSDITGVPMQDMIGCHFTEFVALSDRHNILEQLEKRKQGSTERYEAKWDREDGAVVHTMISPRPIVDEQGVFRGSFGVITDITEKKVALEELAQREKDLIIKASELADMNAALKVLLNQRDTDKAELEEKVLANANELVQPYIDQLKIEMSDGKPRRLLEILEMNLENLLSPFAHRVTNEFRKLTPNEIKVAHLVKDGITNKEIAEIMSISVKTVEYYRDAIRSKLGLKKTKTNLKSYLRSIA